MATLHTTDKRASTRANAACDGALRPVAERPLVGTFEAGTFARGDRLWLMAKKSEKFYYSTIRKSSFKPICKPFLHCVCIRQRDKAEDLFTG